MMKLIYLFLAVASFVLVLLLALRLWDEQAERKEWSRLLAQQAINPAKYGPNMVSNLPELVQRFFNFAITPGTPLFTVAEIDMDGAFSLGSKDKPNYQLMDAKQILATPTGFLWKTRLAGKVPISGSDSAAWTRFRVFGNVAQRILLIA